MPRTGRFGGQTKEPSIGDAEAHQPAVGGELVRLDVIGPSETNTRAEREVFENSY